LQIWWRSWRRVDGRAMNTFQFTCNDVGKLRNLMRKLGKIDGVYEVDRM
jgi:hypothetical protein